MKPIALQPGRAEMAYRAILDDICDGSMPPGTQLVQEELAAQLGVSRQPVQQALARLKGDGLLEEAPGRGLCVPILDLSRMRLHYEIRSALDQLAARLAAARASTGSLDHRKIEKQGKSIVTAGQRAVSKKNYGDMIRRDIEFHSFVYSISGNELIEGTAEVHWRFLRRAMGDVLLRAQPPPSIWQQHEEILNAIVSGEPSLAAALAANHIEVASEALEAALQEES